MYNPIQEKIKKIIEEGHSKDQSQLDVIFSEQDRILVEAPAGYGKTKTMISKIAYMLAMQKIPNPKKILALTYTINGAYKIKKDVSNQVPELLKGVGIQIHIHDIMFASNYHGFCRSILKKYGYLLHENLRNIDQLKCLDETDKYMYGKRWIAGSQKKLSDYSEVLKKIEKERLEKELEPYNEIIINELLPQKAITYNSILTLVIRLFRQYPKVLEFYQKYFRAILIDEYQDTNFLSYWLISLFITEQTIISFFGDPLQKIYGFLGAIPNIFPASEKNFSLKKFELKTNYRFSSNHQMMTLDNNLREIVKNSAQPCISKNATIDLFIETEQKKETDYIIETIQSLQQKSPGCKIAILVKQRNQRNQEIILALKTNNLSYFNVLFTDGHEDNFHKECSSQFDSLLKSDEPLNSLSKKHIEAIEKKYVDDPVYQPLITLLKIFWKKLFTEFSSLEKEEKRTIVKDTFEAKQLRQYLEYVEENLVLSTVHSAKGLEWDFVILPFIEKYIFPYCKICQLCTLKTCKQPINTLLKDDLIDELCVFYVAVTRAKKQVFFTAQSQGTLSCFLKLPGFSLRII